MMATVGFPTGIGLNYQSVAFYDLAGGCNDRRVSRARCCIVASDGFLFVSRFACPCGFLGQSGVKVLKVRRTQKPSLRYRLPFLSFVQGLDISYPKS